jgi:hypothetical protein
LSPNSTAFTYRCGGTNVAFRHDGRAVYGILGYVRGRLGPRRLSPPGLLSRTRGFAPMITICGLSGQPSSPTLEAKRRAIMSSTIFSTGRPPSRMVKRRSSRGDTIDEPVLFSHQSRRRIGGGPLRPFVPTNGRRMCLCHSANAGTPEEKPSPDHASRRAFSHF